MSSALIVERFLKHSYSLYSFVAINNESIEHIDLCNVNILLQWFIVAILLICLIDNVISTSLIVVVRFISHALPLY